MRTLAVFFSMIVAGSSLCSGQDERPNRLTYLDEACSAYHPGIDFPKLSTPQWVGEEGVDAVVVLSIDDMRDPRAYEAFLRPILDRLKRIDGRAPVSIMTCSVSADDPQLQSWIGEGLSIEVHTIDHPCPCLQKADFAQAKRTFDACVDLMATIPNNRPVAFRMPCCDSINSPSPRFWSEVFHRWTPRGDFLEIDSSVFNVITENDPHLPKAITRDGNDRPRFRRYLPFPSFVNTIEDYPYPYVIGNTTWQFPCAVPSDWQAQHVQGVNHQVTVDDWKRVLDATIIKQGVLPLVFHPHGWIRNDQIVELIDYAEATYGSRVKFLTFRESLDRINQNLLGGQALKSTLGSDNGIRILDIDHDGYMDIAAGNQDVKFTRIWSAEKKSWRVMDFPTQIVVDDAQGLPRSAGVRFGVMPDEARTFALISNLQEKGAWCWNKDAWVPSESLVDSFTIDGVPIFTASRSRDNGVRFRDLDHDGITEAILGDANSHAILTLNPATLRWQGTSFKLPEGTRVVDQAGRDAGLRWIDLDADGDDDLVFSDQSRTSVHRFESMQTGWQTVSDHIRGEGERIPMIVREGTNNGAWVHSGQLWWQNEDTSQLSDGVDRRSFSQLLAPNPATEKPPAEFPRFESRTIDPHVGEICYGVTLADVDGDKRQDIVAVSEQSVVWYSNPNWEKHVIIDGQTEPHNVCIAPFDIDGDGQIDFALGAGWTKVGTLQWLSRGKSLEDRWTVHPIGVEPWLHRIRFADVLGKGKPQLVASPLNKSAGGGVRLMAFEIPAQPASDQWRSTIMDHSLNRLHNHWHVDSDGNGSFDTITASQEGVHRIVFENGQWRSSILVPGGTGDSPETSGAGEIKSGRLAGSRDYLATIEPMHGTDVVVYISRGQQGGYERVVLDQTMGRGHALWTANLDDDADDELIVGHSDSGSGSPKGPGVFVFDAVDGGSQWRKIVIDDGGMATEDLIAADLTGDGHIDIVAGGRASHNVKLYINQGQKPSKEKQ